MKFLLSHQQQKTHTFSRRSASKQPNLLNSRNNFFLFPLFFYMKMSSEKIKKYKKSTVNWCSTYDTFYTHFFVVVFQDCLPLCPYGWVMKSTHAWPCEEWNKCLEDEMLYIHDKNDLINFADEQVCVAGIVTVEN